MMINRKKIIKNNRGQALVEFALVLPMLLLLVFGIVEFGRAYYTYISVAGVARETARAAVVRVNDTDMETKMDNVTSGLDIADITVRLDHGDGGGFKTIYDSDGFDASGYSPTEPKGTQIDAEVQYVFHLFVPVISDIVGETMNLTASCKMAME